MVFITDMVGITEDERDMLTVADTVELVAFVVTVDVVAPVVILICNIEELDIGGIVGK